MSGHRFFFRAGAATWIAGGVGHFILIDVLTLHGRTPVSDFIPHGNLLDTMQATTVDFDLLGSTNALLMMAGFSVWVALSLPLFGFAYLLLSRQNGVVLRPFVYLGVAVSATFCAIAAMCFIFPATMGAALATVLFAASWIRAET